MSQLFREILGVRAVGDRKDISEAPAIGDESRCLPRPRKARDLAHLCSKRKDGQVARLPEG
jgi:hypothetical protein